MVKEEGVMRSSRKCLNPQREGGSYGGNDYLRSAVSGQKPKKVPVLHETSVPQTKSTKFMEVLRLTQSFPYPVKPKA